MNKSLAKITETGKSALRIINAVGPLIISQSNKASEAFAEHQLRLAQVDVAKEYMMKEVESLSEVRKNLRNKFYEVDVEERIRLRRDIDETEREIRRLNIVSSAIEQLPPPQSNENASEDKPEIEKPNITLHWMDKFDEYARANNEEWRKQLLTKALAMEAQKPGTIGPRALWVIGTIDEYIFHAYASLLDISTNIAGGFVIPNHYQFNEKPIPNCELGSDKGIGNLVFMLSDLGLIGDTLNSEKAFRENSSFITSYGKKVILVTTKKELTIKGVIPTVLGDTLAKLYTPVPNDLGLEIYNKWLDSINDVTADKKKLA